MGTSETVIADRKAMSKEWKNSLPSTIKSLLVSIAEKMGPVYSDLMHHSLEKDFRVF
jgi:hypothetical protein